MKKSILLLIAVICICISCKKEGTKLTQFDIRFSERADSIYYDSISYAIFNYSDSKDLKDSTEFNNPDVFTYSVKIQKPYNLPLKAEHTYVLKKVELFNKKNNLLFFMPQRTPTNAHKYITVPFIFKAIDGGYLLSVIKNTSL
jgi:hypothetical protein